eukprot:m51a1_g8902 hypothetical protein (358) ;mRNA; r:737830-739443
MMVPSAVLAVLATSAVLLAWWCYEAYKDDLKRIVRVLSGQQDDVELPHNSRDDCGCDSCQRRRQREDVANAPVYNFLAAVTQPQRPRVPQPVQPQPPQHLPPVPQPPQDRRFSAVPPPVQPQAPRMPQPVLHLGTPVEQRPAHYVPQQEAPRASPPRMPRQRTPPSQQEQRVPQAARPEEQQRQRVSQATQTEKQQGQRVHQATQTEEQQQASQTEQQLAQQVSAVQQQLQVLLGAQQQLQTGIAAVRSERLVQQRIQLDQAQSIIQLVTQHQQDTELHQAALQGWLTALQQPAQQQQPAGAAQQQPAPQQAPQQQQAQQPPASQQQQQPKQPQAPQQKADAAMTDIPDTADDNMEL